MLPTTFEVGVISNPPVISSSDGHILFSKFGKMGPSLQLLSSLSSCPNFPLRSGTCKSEKITKKRRKRAKKDPTVAAIHCKMCGKKNSAEWRRGPDGFKSLCNACGIHFAKILQKEKEDIESYKKRNVSLNSILN